MKKVLKKCSLFFLTASSLLTSNDLVIRTAKNEDYDQILKFSVITFAKEYNYTAEQIEDLRKICMTTFDEEQNYLKNNTRGMIAFVAAMGDKIVGYLSLNKTDFPNEYYIRLFVVDIDFQKKKIGIKLLKKCREFLGHNLKRIVCLTNKINVNAKEMYLNFGGKKVENPYWTKFLYADRDISNYIGFEFDEDAITKLEQRFKEI